MIYGRLKPTKAEIKEAKARYTTWHRVWVFWRTLDNGQVAFCHHVGARVENWYNDSPPDRPKWEYRRWDSVVRDQMMKANGQYFDDDGNMRGRDGRVMMGAL